MLELKGRYCKNCKIFTDNIEQEALSMIYRFLDHPMFEGSQIRIMPDVHAGKDIVVGFTVPFTDRVNPDHVGGDIGCSVSTTVTDLPLNPADYAAIEKRIRESVCFGMAIQEKTAYPYAELYKHLALRVQEARRQWPEMVNPADVSERGLTLLLKRIEMNESLFYRSIGTVGGGNHFVEVGATPDGHYAFTAHCGSRGFGLKVWKHWKAAAAEGNGFLTGEAMKGYITDMVVAQAYAEFNHKVIGRLVLDAVCSVGGKKCAVTEEIYTTHNYIDFAMRMLRKGAVAAPEGGKLVIPFNMRDGLVVCRGKGNPDWNFSAPHGAGRLMSRADAKELINLDDYRRAMEGICSTSVGLGTIDESPMAYKDSKEILRLIEDTVEPAYFVKPVINLKATCSYDASAETDAEPED